MYAEAEYDDVDRGGDDASLRESLSTAASRRGSPATGSSSTRGSGLPNSAAHSYGVLARLAEVSAALDRPLLVGPVSQVVHARGACRIVRPLERDWGTAAAVTAAVLAGAHIVRVHAVAEMVQVVRVAEEIRRQLGAETL